MSDEVKATRGRPAGVRRPVIFICAAIVDGNLIQEEVKVPDQEPGSITGSFPKEFAIVKFKEQYNVDPEKISGPGYIKNEIKKVSVSRKRLVIDRDNIDKYTLSTDHKKAQCGSWNGLVNLCVDSPEKAFFIPLSRIGDFNKKTNTPAAGIVNVSDLVFESENIETISSEQSI